MPSGLAALAVALLPALVAWNWNALEGLAGHFVDGGAIGLVPALVLFVLSWGAGLPMLRAWSRRPVRDGALAGLLVAAVMVVMMLRIVATLGPGNWPLVVIIGLPFYALAVGLGTATGVLARGRAQGSGPAGRGRRSTAAGLTCIIAGALVFLVSVMFFLPPGSYLLFLPLLLGGGLIAIGIWSLLAARTKSVSGH